MKKINMQLLQKSLEIDKGVLKHGNRFMYYNRFKKVYVVTDRECRQRRETKSVNVALERLLR